MKSSQRGRECVDARVVELGEQDDALVLRQQRVREPVRIGSVPQDAGPRAASWHAAPRWRSIAPSTPARWVRRSSSVVDSSAAKFPNGQPTASST